MSSMETNQARRRVLITAVAPVAWGSTYLVTETLPAARPPALRRAGARPARSACVLLAVAPAAAAAATGGGRRVVLGVLQHRDVLPADLPGGLPPARAASPPPCRPTSPLAVMALALARSSASAPAGSGSAPPWSASSASALLVLRSPGQRRRPRPGRRLRLGARLARSASCWSSAGRRRSTCSPSSPGSWSSAASLLLPVALLVEGAPPALDLPAVGGFLWLAVVGTGARLLLLVPRPAQHARRRGLADRPGQPGGRHRCSASCSPASCSAGPGARHGAGARRRPRRPARRPDRGPGRSPAHPGRPHARRHFRPAPSPGCGGAPPAERAPSASAA